MNRHHGAFHIVLERCLDAVADGMGVVDAHRARHHQVELDEGGAPGVPRAEVVRLERAFRLLGDRLADLLQHVVGHRLVHQPADRLPHQHPSPPQDVQRDESGDDRIEHQPAGEGDQRDADQHAERGDDIGEQMVRIGEQRRRAPPAPNAKQQEAPHRIDDGGETVDRQAKRRRIDRLRVEIAEIGLAQDGKRGDHDQHAFHHRRQIFDLVMAVGVVGVGRHRAQAHGKEGRHRGRDIDDALRRVGIKRHAAGDAIGRIFEREHQHADGNAAKGQPDDLLHDGKLALIGCGRH